MSKSFSVDTLLETENQGQLDTKIIPAPVGLYLANVTGVEGKGYQKENGEKGAILFYKLEITDERVTNVTFRTPTRMTYKVFLQLTDDGQLDLGRGKNIQLGRLLEAINVNTEEDTWTVAAPVGEFVVAKVNHEYNDETGEPFGVIRSVFNSQDYEDEDLGPTEEAGE